MAFSPENLKIWVNSREIHAFIQTATYPLFTKGTRLPPPLLGLPQGPPHRLHLLAPLVGKVEGLVQGTLGVALDLFGVRQGRLVVGRPTLGQCGLLPRGGRLLHQNLASVRHVGGHTGPQGLHIQGLRGGLGRDLRHLPRLGGGVGPFSPMGGGGASASTTTTSGPRFVCFPGLPPLAPGLQP